MLKLNNQQKLQITEDLICDLEKYLQGNFTLNIKIKKNNDDDYYNDGLHCSSLGACLRQVALQYLKYPKKEYTLQQILNFNRGNFYHELVYIWLKNSNRYKIIHKEYSKLKLPEPFRGKFDVLLQDTQTGYKILADIKTANSNQFKKFSDFLPQQKHIYQISAYYYGYPKKDEIDLLMIMYFSNGNDRPQFYIVDYYKDITNLMFDYGLNVLIAEDKKILPPVLNEISDKNEIWQCSYCQFLDVSCEGYLKKGGNN